ncbi:HintN domain-containing protein [Balamuthia mandrillaris]
MASGLTSTTMAFLTSSSGAFFAMLNPFVALLRNNQGNNFTEVTNEALPALTPCHNNGCMMEWGDFDGDNRVDLFVAVAGGTKTVCLNNGNELSTFTEVDVSATFGVAPIEGAVRAGDFDGDGKDDLVWVRPAISGVYRSNGMDGTSELFPGGVLPQVRACAVRFVDYDGDAFLDLAISGGHASGSNSSGALLRNTGSVFEDVTDKELGSPPPLPLNPPGARMVWVDVDGNRSPDFSSFVYAGVQLLANIGVVPEDESSSSISSSFSSSSSSSSSESNDYSCAVRFASILHCLLFPSYLK